MKANPGKSHILLSNKKTEVKINDVVLTSNVEEKLHIITLHYELKFEKHITGICNKASQKIHVLSRITSYMSLNKWRPLRTFLLHINSKTICVKNDFKLKEDNSLQINC